MRNKKRACYVVCYKDPEYIRTRTLVQALSKINGIELLVIKNRYRSFLRYIEVPARLAMARIKFRPDIFIVGFRAHEIFWLLYPSMVGKRIVFDEFINLHDWLVNEHHKINEQSLLTKLADRYMRWVIKKSDVIFEDTEAHAKLSTQIYGTPPGKIVVVPVGADEETFYPRSKPRKATKFEVFFFGNMLPLHGLDVILESIKLLSQKGKLKEMRFTLVGGKGNQAMIGEIRNFIKLNKLSNSITYKEWVKYHELPDYIAQSDLCLGGPFGNTGQARRVITGKTYQFLAMAKTVVIGQIENMEGFKDRRNCLLVEQRDPKALADTLEWAFDNKTKMQRIAQQGYRLYKTNFSIEAISKKMKPIIENL
ncbi:MAG TPA: glycosyltransferase [Candidatus Saccharimonadales bacterium]|nr:glycosyltransferase [Candidatus Saccharimonadales bacterium]